MPVFGPKLGVGIFLTSTTFKPNLHHIEPPVKGNSGLSPKKEVMETRREAELFHSFGTGITNSCSHKSVLQFAFIWCKYLIKERSILLRLYNINNR